MDIDELKYKIKSDFKLSVSEEIFKKEFSEKEEALFHLPMLIYILLYIGNIKNLIITTENAVGLVVDTLFEMHSNYIISEQRLRLSSKLRRNIVEGIVFLESSEMIFVDKKIINATEKGKNFLNKKESLGISKTLSKRVKSAVSRASARGGRLI